MRFPDLYMCVAKYCMAYNRFLWNLQKSDVLIRELQERALWVEISTNNVWLLGFLLLFDIWMFFKYYIEICSYITEIENGTTNYWEWLHSFPVFSGRYFSNETKNEFNFFYNSHHNLIADLQNLLCFKSVAYDFIFLCMQSFQ